MPKKTTILIFVFLLFSLAVKAQPKKPKPVRTPPKVDDQKTDNPYELTAKDAAAMEVKLRQNPKDLETREALINYYSAAYYNTSEENPEAKKALQRHRKFLIQNFPEEDLSDKLGSWEPEEDLENPDYLELKNELLKQVALNKTKTAVRFNAVEFLQRIEPEAAEKLLKEGQTLDAGNMEFSDRLMEIYETRIKSLNEAYDVNEENASETETDKFAVKLIAEGERELGSLVKDEKLKLGVQRFELLVKLGTVALEMNDAKKARTFAETILRDFVKPVPDADDNKAIYYGYNLLGRVRLREGDTAKAKEYLARSISLLAGSSWEIDDAQMDLAAELLGKGEKQAVLNYVREASKVTTNPRPIKIFRRWERQLKRNLMPFTLEPEY